VKTRDHDNRDEGVDYIGESELSVSYSSLLELRYRVIGLSSNRNLNLDTGLNVDDDLLDNLGRSVEVDKTLVDSHFKGIPCLRTLTAGSLTGGDAQVLRGQADRALDAQLLALGTLDQLRADLL